jgi:hypothetical protein
MRLFLLLFGVILTAAGIALGASGVSVRDHVFDPAIVTAGLVAAVGGLLLIGLGLVVNVLQRIERALAARPMPRPARSGEAITTAEAPSPPVRIPFPPKPEARLHPVAVAATASPVLAEDKAVEPLREIPPLPARVETSPAEEEPDVPLSPVRAAEEVGELRSARAAGRGNGASAVRIAPQLDVNARPTIPVERPRGTKFNSFWPRAQRPTLQAQPAPVPAAATPAVELEQSSEPPTEAAEATVSGVPVAPQETPVPVSVLKSGVVDGMAYTLYSDGSIEAQLPQGMLRFGSITELRNHIEQRA